MKRFLFLLISFVLVFLLLPVSAIPFSAEESPVWDGKAAEEFAGGTGTAEDPYIIKTAQQLALLSRSVSVGTSSYENEYVKLANNIILNDTSGWENWDTTAPANKWTPIGNEMFNFRGTFDGNGFTVSGIYCFTSDYRGLFGYAYAGKVLNVGVVNSYIKGSSDTGGIVGYAFSCTVSNCYYTGKITGTRAIGGIVGYLNGGTVRDCYNTGPVTGIADGENNIGIGGVVGYAIADPLKPAVISNCYNTAAVIGTDSQNGGIAGTAISCKINNCCNTGTVGGLYLIGGLAGYSHTCTFNNCYNINTVEGTGEFIGGISGWAISCAVENCYNAGLVKGDKAVGGIAGDISSYGRIPGFITDCYNRGVVQGNQKTGGVAGWVLGIKGWFTSASVSNSYYLEKTASGGINKTDVSGQAVSLTDAQMKQREPFADWDLTDVWEFGGGDLGYDYPTLIGNKHRETGDIAAVIGSNVKPNTSRILIILIVCIAAAALITAYVFYTKKKMIENQ